MLQYVYTEVINKMLEDIKQRDLLLAYIKKELKFKCRDMDNMGVEYWAEEIMPKCIYFIEDKIDEIIEEMKLK